MFLKSSFTLSLALLFVSFGFAQNTKLIELNTSKTDLLSILSIESATVLDADEKSILAKYGDENLSYKLNNDGNLYHSEMDLVFKNKNSATNYFNKLVEFHSKINGKMTNDIIEDKMVKKTVKRGSLTQEVYLIQTSEKSFQVKMVRKDSDLAPNKASVSPAHS